MTTGSIPAPRAPESALPGDQPPGRLDTSDADQAVFAALARLLERTSLQDITVSQIITEARISPTTFYLSFSSKFSVVSAVLVTVVDELSRAMAPAVRSVPPEPPAVALRRRLRAMGEIWGRNRAVLRAVVENWPAVPELRAIWFEMLEDLTATLAAEIARERELRGAPPECNARQVATVLVWAAERVLYVSGLGVDDELPGESQATDPLLELWAGALYGDAHGGSSPCR